MAIIRNFKINRFWVLLVALLVVFLIFYYFNTQDVTIDQALDELNTGQNNEEEIGHHSQNSFQLLWEAIRASKQPMWASLQILTLITVVLASIFYFAETNVQPKEYNYWKSLLWAFTHYIGDPGKFSGPGPKTITGRIVATFIGIVGIMIFAVPAGLVGTGFMNAVEQSQYDEHLLEINNRLRKSFTREQDASTQFRFVPRYVSLGTLQAKKNMTERDIMDAIENSHDFRLRNLATAETKGKHAIDQLVIEMFPHNTPYGALINRGSNITIACPSSASEAGIGNFGYYLALIGGFNYISKEIEPDLEDWVSFYNIEDFEEPSERVKYISDLKKLSSDKGKWIIFLIISDRQSEDTFHFVTKADEKETGTAYTVLEKEKMQNLFNSFSKDIKDKFELTSELDSEYKPVKKKNSAIVFGGGKTNNAFTIRVASEFATWDPRYISVAQEMARIINENIGNPKHKVPEEKLKERGVGFLDI